MQVRAQVSGVLQSVQFKEGDKVKAGQVLFQIDPRTFQAQYNQALAALARDKAQLENARAQQERLQPLLKREYITRQEYDVAVTSAKSLEATVRRTRPRPKQARIQLEFARITRADLGSHRDARGQAGQSRAGGRHAARRSSRSTRWTRSSCRSASRSGSSRRSGASRTTRTCASRSCRTATRRRSREGKLVFVDNTVTPQTGTVLLKTRVPNANEVIWPGQFVNVRIVLTIEPEAVVVPEAAVQPGQDGSFVYLIDENSKVKVQPVQDRAADRRRGRDRRRRQRPATA